MNSPIILPGRAWQANSYIIDSILVDAGINADRITQYAHQIKKIVLTHGHFDHIVHAKEIAEICGAEIYIGKYDYEFLTDPSLSLSSHFGASQPQIGAHTLDNGDTLDGFTVYHTPGHTRGSISLFKDGCLFSGDTVFPDGSYGRTDFPTGSQIDMRSSLEFLSTLPVDSIYCGHGSPVLSDGHKHILLSVKNV